MERVFLTTSKITCIRTRPDVGSYLMWNNVVLLILLPGNLLDSTLFWIIFLLYRPGDVGKGTLYTYIILILSKYFVM